MLGDTGAGSDRGNQTFDNRDLPDYGGHRDRCEFRSLLRARGCIDLAAFTQTLRRTVREESDTVCRNCAAKWRYEAVSTSARLSF
ncbi:hypothetical protein Poly41_10670 [Novipirellula artificiosorum]|uniref:Uncharacterized protein n=1 Tax=Novipirellula artificiosorum TaxID=2528016 RepID=A0A5C6E453_9BACT|nr:hypothetical protein Poly41_10670 [Novipirellula artificiosorum]